MFPNSTHSPSSVSSLLLLLLLMMTTIIIWIYVIMKCLSLNPVSSFIFLFIKSSMFFASFSFHNSFVFIVISLAIALKLVLFIHVLSLPFLFYFTSYLAKIMWFWRWMVVLLSAKIIVTCNLTVHLQRCCHSLVCWPENHRTFIWWLHNLIYWLLGHRCYKLHFLSHHHMAKSELYIFVVPQDLEHCPVSKACFATNIFHSVSSKN